jgi:hypothetical protein
MPADTINPPQPPTDDDDIEEREPPSLPVEPDEGPVPAVISDDPEHDRLIDPED